MKIWIKAVLVLFLALGLFIAFLPAIFSSSWGQKGLMAYANRHIPGHISARSIQLSWLSGQQIEGLSLCDSEGEGVFSFDSIRIDSSLFQIWRHKGLKLSLDGLQAALTYDAHGTSNWEKALGPLSPAPIKQLAPFELTNAQGQVHIGQPIKIQLSGNTVQGNLEGHFKVDAHLSGFAPDQIHAQIHSLKVQLVHFPVALLDQCVALNEPQLSGLLQAALGTTLDASVDQVTNGSQVTVRARVNSSHLQADLQGAVAKDTFSLTQPATIRLSLTPELIALTRFPLHSARALELRINSLSTPLSPSTHLGKLDANLLIDDPKTPFGLNVRLDLLPNQIQGTLTNEMGRAQFEAKFLSSHQMQGKLTIGSAKELVIPWEIDGTVLTFGTNDLAGKLQGRINVVDDSHVQAQIDLEAVPTALLERFSPKKGLTQLLGTSFDIKLKANWSAKEPSQNIVDVQLQGDTFSGNALLLLGETVTLKPGSPEPKLRLTLAPFKGLINSPALTFTISSLNIPYHSFKEGSLAASLSFDEMHFKERASTFKLPAVIGTIEGNRGELVADISALDNSWSSLMVLKDGSLEAKAQLQRFPATRLAQALYPEQRLKVEALLGTLINANIALHLQNGNGPVQLKVEGQNGRVDLDGKVAKGVFFLNRPFQYDVVVTRALGEGVLQDFLPLFSGILSADERIAVKIDPEGFSLPLKNRSALQIGKMRIDLGKVRFSNEGQLGKLMGALKVRDEEVISVWFTPIYTSVTSGIVNLQRFDMLVMERYPLAAWGTIDQPENWIEMVVGLSGKTLQQTLGLKLLDRNFMLQIPLRGKIGSAKLDKGKIGSTLAGLAAQMQGTPQGVVLGTVIGLATGGGSLMQDQEAPPPTTQPLPWESAAEGSQQNDKPFADNPVELIQKGANSLLKSLLR